tara:strand:- start:264 stop:818 length:555 start_codon:yes stop_codon:yes gene_type:complete
LIGLFSGILCVWLLIKENIWTFPIGLIYAIVSVIVFHQGKLYADVLLNGYYVAMNAYGWYFWLYGGSRTSKDTLAISSTPRRIGGSLLVLTILGTLLMGFLFDNNTDASLPYWDSLTTCMSFAAMWMTARKYIENWAVWLIVDLLSVGIYLIKGIELYAILYGLYLIMAIVGWSRWKKIAATQQ